MRLWKARFDVGLKPFLAINESHLSRDKAREKIVEEMTRLVKPPIRGFDWRHVSLILLISADLSRSTVCLICNSRRPKAWRIEAKELPAFRSAPVRLV
jgi:hypothetical protein